MKNDFVIKILFVENSLEEAEQIISLLRNTGIAVRPARATQAEQVQTALVELEPDLVMFDPGVKTIQLRDLVQQLDAYGRDYSLLGLVNEADNQVVADLFAGGARGLALRSHPKQLITVL
ncbi:MAG: diguanylate cyclase, partial [Rhodanobacter sp.]